MVLIQSLALPKVSSNDLYDGVKNGERWSFEFLERTLFSGHLLELNGDKDLAFDLYHDVILELYLKIIEGKLTKTDENGTGLVISWVKRHLDWKRRDYWKSSRYKDVVKLDEHHEQTCACFPEIENKIYFNQVITIIEKMTAKNRMILQDKLVDELEWKVIYQKYPLENQGSLRVLFSNSLKSLRVHLSQ